MVRGWYMDGTGMVQGWYGDIMTGDIPFRVVVVPVDEQRWAMCLGIRSDAHDHIFAQAFVFLGPRAWVNMLVPSTAKSIRHDLPRGLSLEAPNNRTSLSTRDIQPGTNDDTHIEPTTDTTR